MSNVFNNKITSSSPSSDTLSLISSLDSSPDSDSSPVLFLHSASSLAEAAKKYVSWFHQLSSKRNLICVAASNGGSEGSTILDDCLSPLHYPSMEGDEYSQALGKFKTTHTTVT